MAGSVWDEVLDTEHAVVVRTYIERWPRKGRPPEKVLVIVVEPDEETRCRCPECGQRGRPVEHDVKRWRTFDVHGKRTFLESQLPRIVCPQHGKITAAVPWAVGEVLLVQGDGVIKAACVLAGGGEVAAGGQGCPGGRGPEPAHGR